MEKRALTGTYVKETVTGIAAACVVIVVILLLMHGGPGVPVGDAVYLLLLAFAAPFLFLSTLPWLAAVYVLTGLAVFFQYRHLPPRFMRYVVGGEIVGWQVLGLYLLTEFVPS